MEMNERFPALSGPLLLHAIRYVAAGYPFGYYLIYVAIWCDKRATHEELTSWPASSTLFFTTREQGRRSVRAE